MKKRFLATLSKDEKLFFNVFQYAAIGMALVSPDGKWLMVNKALCDLIGYSEEELLKLTFQDITHPDDLDEDLHYVKKMLSGDLETYQMEKRYFHKDGSTIYILLSVSLIRDKKASPMFFISQLQDITARKLLEAELVRQATEDMLTGISNRRRFYDLAERELLRGERYNDPMVLLMLDIDHFKKVNDTFGHGVGDKAIKHMADVCCAGLRSFDLFGRIGGEEFSAMLIKTDAIMGHQIAERLRKSVEKRILTTDKGVVKFTISIGGVAFSGNQHSLDYRMKQADEALYKAKSTGRNRTILLDELAAKERRDEALQTGFLRLEWNKAYECGNKQIDEEHRNLFKLANTLLTAMIAHQEKSVCQKYIEELIFEALQHFKTEEKLIAEAGYPYTQEHSQIHLELENEALRIARLHKTGKIAIAEVFHFLALQLVSQHMLYEDRRFFSCFSPELDVEFQRLM